MKKHFEMFCTVHAVQVNFNGQPEIMFLQFDPTSRHHFICIKSTIQEGTLKILFAL